MMRTTRKLMALGALLATVLTASATVAQDGTEPLGGHPPESATASVKDFDY
jgi:hypothetical protein